MVRTILSASRASVFDPSVDGDAPFSDPGDYVPDVLFDGRFGYYSVAHAEDTPVNHLAVAADIGVRTDLILSGMTVFDITTWNGRGVASYVIATHNLGIVPHYKVSDELGALLSAGRPIQQVATSGYTGLRTVRIEATTTQIILHEVASPGRYGIPAISKTYSVRVFRPIGPVAGVPGFLGRPSRVQMANGAADSEDRLLRVALPGETHVVKPFGRASDCKRGQIRYVTADGTTYDTDTVIGAASQPYNGSFTGPSLLDVVL